MNGGEMITKFNNMVQDSLDEDYQYQLLNDAKDEVEAMQVWLKMLKETTYTASAGSGYTTALGALPTRFALAGKVWDDSQLPYEQIDFDDRYNKVHSSFGFFIDHANDEFYLAGENSIAKTIYLYYTDYSEDLTAGTTWTFPSRFHAIIPYKMAEIYFASDAGEKSRAWDDRWAVQYERILARMYMWNDQLKVKNRRVRGTHRGRNDNPRGLNV